MTGEFRPTYITPYYVHLDKPVRDGKCYLETDPGNLYDDSVICPGTTLRGITIGNVMKKEYFINQALKVFNVNDELKNFNNTNGG